MVLRRCPHCEAEIEVLPRSRVSCPVCGLDPSLPRIAFSDAPAYFIGGDPRSVALRAEAEPPAESSPTAV